LHNTLSVLNGHYAQLQLKHSAINTSVLTV